MPAPHPPLDPALLSAVAARRGRDTVYGRLSAKRTALVVIDLQRAFMDPGAPAEVANARAILPIVNRLAGDLRARGATIAWVRATFRPAGWPPFFEHMVSPEISQRILAALQPESELHALHPDLRLAADDLVVAKFRFSAFLPGASELPALLRARGIDTVLIAGCMTNMCCDSSARDAVMTDFRTIMVADANAARDDAAHLSALTSFLTGFGDVLTADQVLSMIDA